MLMKYKPSEMKKKVSDCDISTDVDGVASPRKLGAGEILKLTRSSTKLNQCHNDEDKCTSVRNPKGCSNILCYRNILVVNY